MSAPFTSAGARGLVYVQCLPLRQGHLICPRQSSLARGRLEVGLRSEAHDATIPDHVDGGNRERLSALACLDVPKLDPLLGDNRLAAMKHPHELAVHGDPVGLALHEVPDLLMPAPSAARGHDLDLGIREGDHALDVPSRERVRVLPNDIYRSEHTQSLRSAVD